MTLPSKLVTLFTVALAIFMDVLDSNIINTAIPAMSQSLQVHPIDLKIALISYLLSLAVFIPISGWAADRYGTKRIFIFAVGLFTLSSFWCGYARTLVELVCARSVQGIGGAFMISLGRLIIARTFKRQQLVEAMNTLVIVVSVAVMLGPFIGGVITERFSWPWIFWVNIPAGILTILLCVFILPEHPPKHARPFDRFGFITFSGSIAMFCFALSSLSDSHIELTSALWMLATAALLLLIYVMYAKNTAHPVIQIQLLRIRTFRVSVVGNLCARLGFGGTPFLLPLLQQIGLGFSAELSGLLLAPMAMGIIFSKLVTFRILKKVGYRRYLFFNTFLVGLSLWAFQLIDLMTSTYTIAALTFIFGVCISAQYSGMNSLAFADIPEDTLSASTSITSTMQVLAQSLGVAVSAILLRYFTSQTNTPLSLPVFHHTFFAMGILTFMAAFIFMQLKPGEGKQMLEDEVVPN